MPQPPPPPLQFLELVLAHTGLPRLQVYAPPRKEAALEPASYKFPEAREERKALRTSYVGTPIYTELRFLPEQYALRRPDGSEDIITTPEVALDAAIVTATRTKNVVTAAPLDWDGTVKEVVQNGDWQYNIRGWVFPDFPGGAYPAAKVREWKRLFDAPVPLRAVGRAVELLEVTHLLLTTIDFAAGRFANIQEITLTALSDTPPDIVLTTQAPASVVSG